MLDERPGCDRDHDHRRCRPASTANRALQPRVHVRAPESTVDACCDECVQEKFGEERWRGPDHTDHDDSHCNCRDYRDGYEPPIVEIQVEVQVEAAITAGAAPASAMMSGGEEVP